MSIPMPRHAVALLLLLGAATAQGASPADSTRSSIYGVGTRDPARSLVDHDAGLWQVTSRSADSQLSGYLDTYTASGRGRGRGAVADTIDSLSAPPRDRPTKKKGTDPAPVPAPGTSVLLVAGGLALAALLRRRPPADSATRP